MSILTACKQLYRDVFQCSLKSERKNPWKGLFFKFFVSLLIISTVSTASITGFTTWQRQSQLRAAFDTGWLQAAVLAQAQVLEHVSLKNTPTMHGCNAAAELVLRRVLDNDVFARAAANKFQQGTREGRIAILLSGGAYDECRYPSHVKNELLTLARSGAKEASSGQASTRFVDTGGDYWMSAVSVPLSGPDGASVTIAIQAFDPWQAFLNEADRDMTWLWPYLIASNLGTALLLVFFLLRRISHAGGVADAWAQGQLDVRISDNVQDEFGRLAQRFDFMADALDSLIQTKQDIAAQSERSHLARELHDTAKQRCFALGLQISLLKRLCSTDADKTALVCASLKLVEHLQQDMSNVIQRLSAPTIVELGLAGAVRKHLESLLGTSHIEWSVAIPPQCSVWLDEHEALASELLLIASEAAANTLRHSNASLLTISLVQQENGAVWSVVDNGCGFDPASVDLGMGLANMRQRADALPGGKLMVHSTPGQGTRIEASFHLSEPRR